MILIRIYPASSQPVVLQHKPTWFLWDFFVHFLLAQKMNQKRAPETTTGAFGCSARRPRFAPFPVFPSHLFSFDRRYSSLLSIIWDWSLFIIHSSKCHQIFFVESLTFLRLRGERWSKQHCLSHTPWRGASCVAWTAEKNGKPKKDLRLPFSLVRFFWASKRNEQ